MQINKLRVLHRELLTKFRRHDGGATGIEYGFVAAMSSLAGLTAWISMGGSLLAMFGGITTDLTNSIPNGG